MPDPTSRIRFDSVLLKKARVILRTTGPDPIWMAWSGCGQTHLVQKQACVQKSSGLVLSERDRPATSFPLSHSAAFFHNRPGSYCATSARIRSGSGCLSGLGQTDPVRKQAGMQESPGPFLAIAFEPIRNGRESD